MFQHKEPLVGTKNLVFQFLELGGDVPLAGGQRLLADERIGNAAHIAAADLNKVSEHFIETNFQLGDSRLLLELGLQLGKNPLAPVHDIPQLVHLGVITRAYGAAVLEMGGRIVDQ